MPAVFHIFLLVRRALSLPPLLFGLHCDTCAPSRVWRHSVALTQISGGLGNSILRRSWTNGLAGIPLTDGHARQDTSPRALGRVHIKLWHLCNASASTEVTGNIVDVSERVSIQMDVQSCHRCYLSPHSSTPPSEIWDRSITTLAKIHRRSNITQVMAQTKKLSCDYLCVLSWVLYIWDYIVLLYYPQ